LQHRLCNKAFHDWPVTYGGVTYGHPNTEIKKYEAFRLPFKFRPRNIGDVDKRSAYINDVTEGPLLFLLVTIIQTAKFLGRLHLCEVENWCSPTNSPAILSIPPLISILLTAVG
jgi:hypothetical protein